jgi:hypothetical protein
MKNVLYIYGYGESVESDTYKWLKENLEANVTCVEYNQATPEESVKKLYSIIEPDINIVIASGLGAWYAIYATMPISLPCILINPVVDGNFETTFSSVMENDVLEKYLAYIKEHSFFEKNIWDGIEDGCRTVVVYSNYDEVVKHDNKFLSRNFKTIHFLPNGKHKLNTKELKYVAEAYKTFTEKTLPQYNKFVDNPFPQLTDD